MTLRIAALSIAVVSIATGAYAQSEPKVLGSSVFATGGSVGGTQPDSITDGDGSVWVEYGNGAVSTGGPDAGSSTVVQYSSSGAVQHVYTIAGLVDGLKFNPVTGMVWALQNNDANATLSLINPLTHSVTGPLKYASPPYVYGPVGPSGLGRGYDDVAFLDGKVYLSFTNPVNPTDSVVQILNQGNNPSGTLTTTSILTAQQTNPLFTSSTQNPPDIDSLKSTPSGQLVLTSEGDGLGPQWATSDGRYTLISNPGTPQQSVSNVRVTNSAGVNVNGMDDVIFPDATAGTLYVADTGTNKVYAVYLTGLNPDTPIVSMGSFDEVALVNPTTGVVGMPLLTGLTATHGMDFVAAPEPSTWALLVLGLAGLMAGARRNKPGAAPRLA
jgi:PEP-CTERM motif